MFISEKCRLLENLQLEPLINQWYVTLPMLAPVPYAMTLTNTQIPIMESYVVSPESHLSLSSDLAMSGGPFVNYTFDRSEEIKQLLAKIKKEHGKLISFSNNIKSFSNYLTSNAFGATLEPEYANIPNELKGYVELVYDLSNRASIRFIEPLLYKSQYYIENAQSVNCSLVDRDERAFVLSTPRLPDELNLQINIPFNSKTYDDFCRMREYPGSFKEIVEKLLIPDDKINLFKSFLEFTDIDNVREEYKDKNIRIRYFGHACLLIEYNGISILTDAFISYNYPTNNKRFTFKDLPKNIDYVLITHGHLDHIVLETLLQIRYKISKIIVPKNSGTIHADPSLKLLLNSLGFDSVDEIDDLEEVRVLDELKIVAMPFLGEHHDLNIKAKSAFLLLIGSKKIYIAADSSNLDPMLYNHISRIYGAIDILFIGMECDGAPLSWFYGALLPEKLDRDQDYSRQGSGSDCQKAMALVKSMQPNTVYVYAMGLEPWFTYILGLNYNKNSKQLKESDKFITECKKQGIISERLFGHKELVIQAY